MHAINSNTQIVRKFTGRAVTSFTANLLHAAYDGPAATKRMASDARVSIRTAEKWWARLATPRADVLLRMVQANARLQEELLQRLGGRGYGPDVSRNGGVAAADGRRAAGAASGLDQSDDADGPPLTP